MSASPAERAVIDAARECASDTRRYAEACVEKLGVTRGWRAYCSPSELALIDALEKLDKETSDG